MKRRNVPEINSKHTLHVFLNHKNKQKITTYILFQIHISTSVVLLIFCRKFLYCSVNHECCSKKKEKEKDVK